MIYSGKVSGKYHQVLINGVAITGITRGRQLKTLKESEMSTEAFGAALKESLRAQGLFSENGRFRLKAHILKVMQPPGRFNMTVTTHVEYKLVDSTTDKIVFKTTVIADYTAGTGDALTSITRRRLANEGSGKRNIALFLDELSQLN